MIPLIAYSDRQTCRPGDKVALKVSSRFTSPYQMELVRLRCADPNPNGPGFKYHVVREAFSGSFPSRAQEISRGSYCEIKLRSLDCDVWTFSVRVQPWLLESDPDTVAELEGGPHRIVMQASNTATMLSVDGNVAVRLPPLVVLRWYELRLGYRSGQLSMSVHTSHGTEELTVKGEARIGSFKFDTLRLAASGSGCGKHAHHFNGRLEDPAVLSKLFNLECLLDLETIAQENIVHWWDFSVGIGSLKVYDAGKNSCHGTVSNMPSRGVRGSRWTGKEMAWRHCPRDYAAIHFHEDDLYDANWQTDFTFQIPQGLSSGVYAVRLQCEGAEDFVPLYVLPPAGRATSAIAVLIPTFTYQAYANFDRANFDELYQRRRSDWPRAAQHHPAENREFGLSTYDSHRDGSGVIYSSTRRPILTDRPGHLAYVDLNGSGLRHLSADLHLIDWLDEQGFAYDVVTDHALQKEGSKVVDSYRCLLTTTHPEYHTSETLDTLMEFLNSGRNLAYLGGNGFYWRIAVSETVSDVLEVRRAESGQRLWESEPGEYYHSLDGEYGGLWRRNGRAPQKLVGVGMCAQGKFEGTYYKRTPRSYDAQFAWMFKGIEEERLGDFGFSGGGAAGFELDRLDHRLGTPSGAVVLARSEKHPNHFSITPEEILSVVSDCEQTREDVIHADLVYFETGKGGGVFSVGSITFCGSLAFHNYENNISQLLRNVVERFSMENAAYNQTARTGTSLPR